MLKMSTLTSGVALLALAAGSAEARVTGFEIVSSQPVFDGRSFGDAGASMRSRPSPSTPPRPAPLASSTSTRRQ